MAEAGVLEELRQSLAGLDALWSRMGYPSEARETYLHDFSQDIKDMCSKEMDRMLLIHCERLESAIRSHTASLSEEEKAALPPWSSDQAPEAKALSLEETCTALNVTIPQPDAHIPSRPKKLETPWFFSSGKQPQRESRRGIENPGRWSKEKRPVRLGKRRMELDKCKSSDDLVNVPVKHLRKVLKDKNCSVWGTKDKLIERVLANHLWEPVLAEDTSARAANGEAHSNMALATANAAAAAVVAAAAVSSTTVLPVSAVSASAPTNPLPASQTDPVALAAAAAAAASLLSTSTLTAPAAAAVATDRQPSTMQAISRGQLSMVPANSSTTPNVPAPPAGADAEGHPSHNSLRSAEDFQMKRKDPHTLVSRRNQALNGGHQHIPV